MGRTAARVGLVGLRNSRTGRKVAADTIRPIRGYVCVLLLSVGQARGRVALVLRQNGYGSRALMLVTKDYLD